MTDFLGDPALSVAVLSLAGSLFSVFVALMIAVLSLRGKSMEASGEIASGARELLEEYRKEINKLKNQYIRVSIDMENISTELDEIKVWREDVIDFIVPFIAGSKMNEQQSIEAGLVPDYPLPDLPAWLPVDPEDEGEK